MMRRWLERLADWRNRKVADPAFRARAARFYLTRPFARQRAGALFDLVAGFVYSQILSACVRLDLFALLSGGPLATSEIAERVGLPIEGTERLLRGAGALGLVEARQDGRFALASLGAALVDNPGVCAMIRHHDMLYRDLADPLMLLKGAPGPELSRYWAYAGGEASVEGAVSPYTALMAASQGMVAAEILASYPLARHRRLLDLGGGDGTFLTAAGRAAPHLDLHLFDLPPVAALARTKFEAAGLGSRASVHGGDMLRDPLPGGADLVTLIRILHDHDDAPATAILRAARRAIAPGGTLLVAEPMAGTKGAHPSGDAYFGFYLLAMGQGRPREAGALEAMLREAGFGRVRSVPTPTPLVARILAAEPAPQV